MMSPELRTILSIPEIRLSLILLGFGQWDDLPLIDTGEQPEQRLMNAFLRLIQMQLFLPVEGGYEMSQDFEALMCHIGQADRVHQMYDGSRILAFLYEKKEAVAVISPDWGNWEHCKVTMYLDTKLTEIAAELAEGKCGTVLRQVDPVDHEHGKYDMEQLAFFFGSKMEETE